MINKFAFASMRNAEYLQFLVSVRDILVKHVAAHGSLESMLDELTALVKSGEEAMIAERASEKVREKNEADRYRDRLHSKLFNYLKSILCDERDERFDPAQEVMKVVKDAGNPTRLTENAQSAMMTALGNRLEPLRPQLNAIGAGNIVDDMMEANRRFIAVEKEYRETVVERQLSAAPASMTALRRQADPVYRAIVDIINSYASVPSKREAYRETIAEMNVLVARYDAMLAARKRERKETAPPTACETCGTV